MSTEVVKKHELPKLSDLVEDTEMKMKDNALTVILNQPPPDKWISYHPTATMEVLNDQGQKVKVPLPYLPIQRVEWLLTSIYGKYKLTIKEFKVLANSVAVTVTLTVTNPVTGEIETQDGGGAVAIQTDKDRGAMDWNYAKSNGVMLALPAAISYAKKAAAEEFGKIFGRDLTRKDYVGYETLLKEKTECDWVELKELYDLKIDAVPETEREGIRKIIDAQMKSEYKKVKNYLSKL